MLAVDLAAAGGPERLVEHARTEWTGPDSPGVAMAEAMGMTNAQLVEQLPALAGMTTGRMAAPEEVAALVLLLASDVAPSVRGAEVVIDGGLLKTV